VFAPHVLPEPGRLVVKRGDPLVERLLRRDERLCQILEVKETGALLSGYGLRVQGLGSKV